MTRAVIFDIDGVLIHGIHARPELTRRWDANLLADFGVDPERFTKEFIFDIFIKKVTTGQMSVIEALERRLPSLGYSGSPMVFHHYWLTHDSVLNDELLAAIRVFKAKADIRLFIATNQEHLRATWLWSHLGLSDIFEDIFYSARVGIRKPETGFSISSPRGSVGRPNRRCSSMTRPKSSPAPGPMAGKRWSITRSPISPSIHGSPDICTSRKADARSKHRCFTMVISTAEP